MVRWEGEGPVTHAFVHEHLRPLHHYVISPVIDLAGQAPVDAYELPDRLRAAVRILRPRRRVPLRQRHPAAGLDIDHTDGVRPDHRRAGAETALVLPAGATSDH